MNPSDLAEIKAKLKDSSEREWGYCKHHEDITNLLTHIKELTTEKKYVTGLQEEILLLKAQLAGKEGEG